MIKVLNDIIDFYRNNSKFLKNQEAKEKFDEKTIIANKVFDVSKEKLLLFFDILLGNRLDMNNMKSMFFPQRFLKNKLVEDENKEIKSILMHCFFIGYLYHFLYMSFPSRENINNVDFDNLFEDWLPKTIIADLTMRSYIEDQKGLPENYLNYYYANSNYDEIFKKKYKFGYFKRGRVYSFLRNIMFCGISYAINYDISTHSYDNAN